MEILQCGFLASGVPDHANSKDITSCTPVPVGSGLIRPFSGGWGFGLAADSAGDLYTWGVNSPTLLRKQGSEDGGADPSLLEKVCDEVVTAAAAFDFGLVVKRGGKLLVFGPSYDPPAGAPPGLYLASLAIKVPVKAVAAGEHHSLLQAENGSVWAFGSNREGQLGESSAGEASAAPLLVLGPGSLHRDAGLLQPAVAMAAGGRHSCVINTLGQCVAWGWSLYGQCGTGRSQPSVPIPTIVKDLGPLKCTGVGAGMAHTVVCTDTGSVYTWGINSDHQLGDGTDTSSLQPKLVESPLLDDADVTKVACGARHTLVLTAGGRALAWGHNKFGALGVGSFEAVCSPREVAVPAGRRVVDVAAGWWHSLLLVELSLSLEGRGLSGGWHGHGS